MAISPKINWRRVTFLGLLWFFIVNGPGACDYLKSRECRPLVVSTCED